MPEKIKNTGRSVTSFLLGVGLLFVVFILLSGCKKEEINIVNHTSTESDTRMEFDGDEETNGVSEKGNIKLELSGHKGEMIYELEDAYWTQNPKACGIDCGKIHPYSFVMMNEDGEIKDVSYPEYFADQSQGKLIDDCRMYVCKVKVTNVDAQYAYEDMYENPYIFRADNLYLNYMDAETEEIFYKTVDYYSFMKEGDHTWSTYELRPGETITYELGFLVGDMIEGMEMKGGAERIYLGNTQGSLDGKYYQIEWSEK